MEVPNTLELSEEPTSAPVKIFTGADVPDTIFPADNAFDIPTLDIALQADYLDMPLTLWGSIRRKTKIIGTLCFYADDYRFNALWSDPSPVLNTGCTAFSEPNFSINNQSPYPIALYNIYRKRWMSRYWQSQGLKCFVDLHVGPRYSDLNLLGVPQGWRSYMTRALDDCPDWLDHDYEIAKQHAGTDDVQFVVYGGSTPSQDKCREQGWIWMPSLTDTNFRGII